MNIDSDKPRSQAEDIPRIAFTPEEAEWSKMAQSKIMQVLTTNDFVEHTIMNEDTPVLRRYMVMESQAPEGEVPHSVLGLELVCNKPLLQASEDQEKPLPIAGDALRLYALDREKNTFVTLVFSLDTTLQVNVHSEIDTLMPPALLQALHLQGKLSQSWSPNKETLHVIDEALNGKMAKDELRLLKNHYAGEDADDLQVAANNIYCKMLLEKLLLPMNDIIQLTYEN